MKKEWICSMVLFLLATFLYPPLTTQAQDAKTKKITMEFKNENLPSAFKRLQKASGYVILFTYDDVNKYTITGKVKEKTISEVLNFVLAGKPLEYSIEGNYVHVTLKKQGRQVEYRDNRKIAVVKGTVVDREGLPLPGANILIKGSTKGTVTDMDGKYSLNVQGQLPCTLVFSYMGMASQEVAVKAGKDVEIEMRTITLSEDENQIAEVVVTGMFRKNIQTFTGSAVTITKEELKQFGNRNVLRTLSNIDPAFNIVVENEYGSDPNHIPEVQIRGASSVPNVDQLQDESRQGLNTPLVILDGFESSLSTLLDMNEDEIESITILKDASATAIYGSQGANGVIVVERKKPEAGKLRFSYSGYLNLEIPDLSSYNLMNAREKLEVERLAGKYDSTNPATDYQLKNQYNYLLSQVNSGVDTDWLSKPVHLGVGHRHNMRLEGGDQTFRYSAALQINDVAGVMKGSDRRTFNGDITLSYMTKHLRFTNSTAIGLTKSDTSPYGTFSDYVSMNPYFEPYDENGTLKKALGTEGDGCFYRWGKNGVANPLWNPETASFSKSNTTTIRNNFSIDWSLTEDFRLRGSIGLSKVMNGSNTFYSPEHTRYAYTTDILEKGKYTKSDGTSSNMDLSFNLQYSHIFAQKHSVYIGANASARESKSSSTTMAAVGFANEKFNFPSMALGYDPDGKPSGSEATTRRMGVTFNANYAYNNRYFVDFTHTTDGNSVFGSKNRFGSFWSAGIGWNVHQEKFMKDVSWINKLKFRSSFGTNGNQSFASYQTLTTYEYSSSSRYYSWIGADVSNLGNDKLKWQRKFNKNFGLELEFLNRRLMANIDYYIETTSDQISSINVPTSTGFSSYIENIGEVENTGFEMRLTGVVYKNTKKNISWMISASVAHNKNRINKLSQAMKDAQAQYEADESSNPYVIYKEGYSMDAIWVVPSYGIDPATGKELFVGDDGEPTFTWSAKRLAACGNTQPKYYGNINSTFRWNKFLVSFSMGYRMGGQIYNQTLADKVENVNYDNNVDRRVYTDRWQKPGDVAQFKGLNETTTTKKTSRFVQDENTFKGNSINVSYEWRSKWLRKNLHLEHLTIQSGIDDLFYISTVKRERGTSYPYSRQYTLSLSAMF